MKIMTTIQSLENLTNRFDEIVVHINIKSIFKSIKRLTSRLIGT